MNQIVQQLQTHRMDADPVGSPPGKQLARRMPAGVLLPYNAISGGTKDSQKSLFCKDQIAKLSFLLSHRHIPAATATEFRRRSDL
ncbi:MAG: hypothetical protein WBW06_11940 [Xanthobacteraceae bacterium]